MKKLNLIFCLCLFCFNSFSIRNYKINSNTFILTNDSLKLEIKIDTGLLNCKVRILIKNNSESQYLFINPMLKKENDLTKQIYYYGDPDNLEKLHDFKIIAPKDECDFEITAIEDLNLFQLFFSYMLKDFKFLEKEKIDTYSCTNLVKLNNLDFYQNHHTISIYFDEINARFIIENE